jgi:hypothetical protein
MGSTLAGIANAFGASAEAKDKFALLANPKAATDEQISSFVDAVFNNLFDRTADAEGQAHWAGQIKQMIDGGQALGSVVTNIAGGAQGQDILALINKVAVNIEYVYQQQVFGVEWSAEAHGEAAAALIDAVNASAASVLTGIEQADALILDAAS